MFENLSAAVCNLGVWVNGNGMRPQVGKKLCEGHERRRRRALILTITAANLAGLCSLWI